MAEADQAYRLGASRLGLFRRSRCSRVQVGVQVGHTVMGKPTGLSSHAYFLLSSLLKQLLNCVIFRDKIYTKYMRVDE